MAIEYELEGFGPHNLPRDAPLVLRLEGSGKARPLFADTRLRPNVQRAMGAVAYALYSEHEGRGRAVSYSRTKGHYEARPARYRSKLYSFATVPAAIDALADLGLAENWKAEPGARGRQSIARATGKLVEWMRDAKARGDKPKLIRPGQPIILRDEGGALRDFQMVDQHRPMYRDLNTFNEAIAGADISGAQAAPVCRIFNLAGPTRAADLWNRNGRIYAMGGAWQSLPKEMRKQLQIDGENVVELDYDAIHPTMLYEEVGLERPADCYEIPGWPRELIKVAFLVLINADRDQGRGAIAHSAAMASFMLAQGLPAGGADALAATNRLIREVARLHAPIAHAFNSDAGARLMRKDSDIANEVMREMIERRGILVLPVHDSFLVRQSKAEILRGVMVEVAHRHGLRSVRVK